MKISILLFVSLSSIVLGAPVQPQTNHGLVKRDMEGLGSLLKNLGNGGSGGNGMAGGGGSGGGNMADLMKQFQGGGGAGGGGSGGGNMADLMKQFQGGGGAGGGGMADLMKQFQGGGEGKEGSPLAGILEMVKNLMGGKDIGEVLKGLTGGKGGGLDFSKMFESFGGSKAKK